MGLNVSYTLALPPPATFEDAIKKISELHGLARFVGFEGYGDIPAVGAIKVVAAAVDGDCHFVHEILNDGKLNLTPVYALRYVAFMTMPGRGTETATFSLGEYPKHVSAFNPLRSVLVDLPPGFSGESYCKTHYASLVDEAHFVRCHRALVHLLDHALNLGILCDVRDAGQYWETRSENVLLSNLRRESAVVARIVGRLRDRLENQNSLVFVAPIMKAPNFEHLELEGSRIINERRSEA